jgi:hypothetical protein
MWRKRIATTVALLGILAVLSACSPRVKPASPYGDPEKTLQNRLGFSPDEGMPSPRVGTLAQLNYAAEACAEASRGTSSIDLVPADSANVATSTKPPIKVAIGSANCSAIYRDFFEEAASLSDLACDEFIDKLYARQQGLSGVSDITNIAGGVLSAAVGIFSLGSVIGSITGVSVSALNLAFDSYAANFLFSIPAGDIRTLVYTQKQVVRTEIASNGVPTIYEAKIHIRDYFLSCTPATVQQYVTKAIQDKASQPFLDDALAKETGKQIALAQIVEAARELTPYLGGDEEGTVVSPQGVAALYYLLAANKAAIAGDPAENRAQRVAAYLEKSKLYQADAGFQFRTSLVDAEAVKLANKMNSATPKPNPEVTAESVKPVVRETFKTRVMRPLVTLGAGNGASMIGALNELLKSLPDPAPPAVPKLLGPPDAPVLGDEIEVPIAPDPMTRRMNPGLLGGY